MKYCFDVLFQDDIQEEAGTVRQSSVFDVHANPQALIQAPSVVLSPSPPLSPNSSLRAPLDLSAIAPINQVQGAMGPLHQEGLENEAELPHHSTPAQGKIYMIFRCFI